MKTIAVLPGDGIGPEVMSSALATLPSGFEYVFIDAGAERYLRTGDLLTDDDMRTISKADALLFGAVGDPRLPDGVLERGILLRLRKELDLYVNLRPFPALGITIVRENTEGPYCGLGRSAEGSAVEMNVNTSAAIDRCTRFAFELARERSEKLTLVHKTNVLQYAGALWTSEFARIGTAYPDVEVGYEHADAAAYHLVRDSSRYDVILTDNLFGDLLSDVAAGVSGGLGKAASANLHPDPTTRQHNCLGLFEPVHGSAPDIAGTGTADATAAIEAARMMLEAIETEEGALA